jgi:hypothetical protein
VNVDRESASPIAKGGRVFNENLPKKQRAHRNTYDYVCKSMAAGLSISEVLEELEAKELKARKTSSHF